MELLLSVVSSIPNLIISSAVLAAVLSLACIALTVFLCLAIKVWFSLIHKKANDDQVRNVPTFSIEFSDLLTCSASGGPSK
jgi:hypothetical protein